MNSSPIEEKKAAKHMKIAAINLDPDHVSDVDFADMVEAAQLHLNAYAEAKGELPATIRAVASEADAAADEYCHFIVYRPDVEGAGGYHDRDSRGMPFARTFTKPYLDNGGKVIAETEADFDSSVLAAFTHENAEMKGDRYCNGYAQENAIRETALEECDACEDIGFPVKLASGRVCWVSDFLLDAWFAAGTPGPWDYCGKLTGPFTLSPLGGGYMIVQSLRGRPVQQTSDMRMISPHASIVHGPKFPAWKLELKTTHGRAAKRSRSF